MIYLGRTIGAVANAGVLLSRFAFLQGVRRGSEHEGERGGECKLGHGVFSSTEYLMICNPAGSPARTSSLGAAARNWYSTVAVALVFSSLAPASCLKRQNRTSKTPSRTWVMAISLTHICPVLPTVFCGLSSDLRN